jgi:hypothetical protein
MTSTFILAFVVFAITVLAMAVGVIVSNRRLRGSCGGLAGLKDEHGRTLCDACSTPSETCRGPEYARSARHDHHGEDEEHPRASA